MYAVVFLKKGSTHIPNKHCLLEPNTCDASTTLSSLLTYFKVSLEIPEIARHAESSYFVERNLRINKF